MSNTPRIQLIINGKAAADEALREAVATLRQEGHSISTSVTWEGGDAQRFATAATLGGVDVVVAAGGDGTLHEVVNGVMAAGPKSETAVGVVPYGTANDFATSLGILKGSPAESLRLACTQTSTWVDVGKINGEHFINVTSGGFGAEVTSNTPPQMKKALGGAAYTLMGIVTAAKMSPYHCKFTLPAGEASSQKSPREGDVVVLAIGNGVQCGGGVQVTPQAKLNDGLLDILVIHDIDLLQIGLIFQELQSPNQPDNKCVSYAQVESLTIDVDRDMQLNLDGEPMIANHFEISVVPQSLRLILPNDSTIV